METKENNYECNAWCEQYLVNFMRSFIKRDSSYGGIVWKVK
jgi:hypothetical protein